MSNMPATSLLDLGRPGRTALGPRSCIKLLARGWLAWLAVTVALLPGAVLADPGSQAPTPDASKAPVPKLSLDEFLRRARLTSPTVGIARAELAGYQALFDRAYYAWTPTLKIESLLAPLPERKLLRQCVKGVDPETGLPAVKPCPGQKIADDETLSADTEIGILTRTTAKLTIPIYAFGKLDAAQRATRAGIDVGHGAVERAQGEIAFLVKKAYYGAQLAASVLDVIQEGRGTIRKAKRGIEKELDKESGRFTRNDLRKLLVRQAKLESYFLETDAQARVAWEALRLAGGFALDEPFELDSLKLVTVHVEPRTTEAYVDLAMLSRPDLRMAEAAVRARRSQVEMATADFYPNVGLVAAFGFARGTTAEDNPDPFANDSYNFLRWGVVLGAEWSLDFAVRLSELRGAEANLAKSRMERDALRSIIRLEIVSDLSQIDRYRADMESRRIAMKAAKGWLISNTLNFGLGLADTDELIDALEAFGMARYEYFDTIYEYNLAIAHLSLKVGTELAVPQPERGRTSE